MNIPREVFFIGNGANHGSIYVKSGSWADLYYIDFVNLVIYSKEPDQIKKYY